MIWRVLKGAVYPGVPHVIVSALLVAMHEGLLCNHLS